MNGWMDGFQQKSSMSRELEASKVWGSDTVVKDFEECMDE